MAGLTSFLKVTVLGDSKPMTSAMRKATRELQGVENSAKRMSANVSKAMGALGLGLGISALKSMAQNAVADAKAQTILAGSMRNVINATDEQIATAEQFIQQMQLQTAILDDDLRPAYSTLIRSTKDASKAQSLLALAADISAGTGKDLGMVTQALAKAYNGQLASLNKLVPGISKAKNPMEELNIQFGGLAEKAANNDPFKKMEVIFNDLSETIGTYLMPTLTQFSTWLSTDEGQSKLQMLADGFGMIFTNIGNIISFLSDNQWIVSAVAGLYAMIKVWTIMSKVMKAAYAITKATTIAQLITTSIQGMKGTAAIVAATAALAGGIALFVTLDNLMGNVPKTNMKPPKRTIVPPPVAGVYDPTKLPGVTGSKSAKGSVKAAQSALVDAIKTVQAKLAEVRQTILNMAAKFFTSVELGFGILDRGASKVFRADRYVRELKRMETALADFKTNLAALQKIGGAQATPLLNQILGMSPEEGAAILKGFAASPELFTQAVQSTQNLAGLGGNVGAAQSLMNGNQTTNSLVAELRLLRQDLAGGKNTYNIKSTMSALEIVNAIRAWEKSTGRRVLIG